MSEKKAPEKKEKEKLVHVTEEQLKAGKEEIMKIVNGQPGAEKLGEMLDKGRKKGRLSSNELMDALEEMDLESEQMDRIYDVLENMGIDTAGEDYLPDLTDGDMPPIEEIEEIPEEEIVDPNTLVDSFGIDDPVRMYLKEIGKVDLLTSEQEVALAQTMVRGQEVKKTLEDMEAEGIEIDEETKRSLQKEIKAGERAKQNLAEANLRLVVSIAKRYVGRGMLFLDLIQEGNVGLMRAVNKFDPDKGIKFSYYAAFWIRAYILKFIMDNWRMVKIGTTQAQRKLFYNLNRERQKLIAEGFDPDAATLAERLGVGEDQIVEMQQRLDASDMSLDATVGDESGSATRMDFLPALGPGIEESLAGMEIAELLQSKIRDILPSLSEKEAYILEHRLLTDDPVTLREIGERYNVTRERVRQLEARLLQKLKTHLSTDIQDFSEDWISH